MGPICRSCRVHRSGGLNRRERQTNTRPSYHDGCHQDVGLAKATARCTPTPGPASWAATPTLVTMTHGRVPVSRYDHDYGTLPLPHPPMPTSSVAMSSCARTFALSTSNTLFRAHRSSAASAATARQSRAAPSTTGAGAPRVMLQGPLPPLLAAVAVVVVLPLWTASHSKPAREISTDRSDGPAGWDTGRLFL